MWSCEVSAMCRGSFWVIFLFTWLKDLFVFHTSPTHGNVNKPGPEEVPCFDHPFILPESLYWADPAPNFPFHIESSTLASAFPHFCATLRF